MKQICSIVTPPLVARMPQIPRPIPLLLGSRVFQPCRLLHQSPPRHLSWITVPHTRWITTHCAHCKGVLRPHFPVDSWNAPTDPRMDSPIQWNCDDITWSQSHAHVSCTSGHHPLLLPSSRSCLNDILSRANKFCAPLSCCSLIAPIDQHRSA